MKTERTIKIRTEPLHEIDCQCMIKAIRRSQNSLIKEIKEIKTVDNKPTIRSRILFKENLNLKEPVIIKRK